MLPLVLLLALTAKNPSAKEADKAFAQGRKLLAEGKTKEACDAFEKSNTLVPALGALLNLAECTALLGNAPRAYGLYMQVEEWARRVGNDARAQVAKARLDELAPKVALLDLDPPAGAEVLIDAQLAPVRGRIALAPGSHILIWTEGGSSVSRTVELKAGERRKLKAPPEEPTPEVKREPEPEPEPKLPPRLEPRPREPVAEVPIAPVVETHPVRRSVGVGFVVVGVVSLVASAVGLAWSLDIERRVRQQQPGMVDFDRPTVTQETFATAALINRISWAGAGVGGAALVAGLTLWLSAGASNTGGAVSVGGAL